MKSALFLLFSSSVSYSLFAMEESKPRATILATEFQACKKTLSPQLQNFIADFATWPIQDREKVKLHDSGFTISKKLGKARHTLYENNIFLWAQARTTTFSLTIHFLRCLQFLKQK